MGDDKNGRRPDDPDALREAVSEGYARVAGAGSSCCGPSPCCGPDGGTVSLEIGYEAADLDALPDGADLGLGCGAPVAAADLKPGETVLDLGSGAGIDAFLAARAVGPDGRVIGVDMTDAMLERARANAAAAGVANVEFHKGMIEELPLSDASVDVILSNCVINLSPEKDRVFREAVRVLKPGGRMVFSDIVLEAPLPPALTDDLDAVVGCVGNASLRADYLQAARDAGFTSIEILNESNYGSNVAALAPLADALVLRTGLSAAEITSHLANVTSLTLRLSTGAP